MEIRDPVKRVHEVPDRKGSVALDDRGATLAAMVVVVVVMMVMLAHDLVVVVVAIPVTVPVALAVAIAMDADAARTNVDELSEGRDRRKGQRDDGGDGCELGLHVDIPSIDYDAGTYR